ncbi:MAG: CsbD family protein [Acidobacteriota bacterium]|nr:CsbD family protein [Acidobacteriota bacterium]
MGLPNRDEMEGKFDQAKGTVKENVGRAFDDRDMEARGAAERAGGHLEEGYGKSAKHWRTRAKILNAERGMMNDE